jgi:hypothetical protein
VPRPLECSQTWALLARDKELASSVIELTLDTSNLNPSIKEVYLGRPTAPRLFVNMDALANLTSLKRVTFIGIPFQTAAEQLAFGHIFSSKSTAMSKEVIFRSFRPYYSPDSWPGADFGDLADLGSIEWFPQTRGMLEHESSSVCPSDKSV